MSRYRSNRLAAASGHTVGIEEAVNDFLLFKNVRGGDIRNGFSLTIGMPVAQTMWPPSVGDAFFSLRDLPTLKIEPAVLDAGHWFLGSISKR